MPSQADNQMWELPDSSDVSDVGSYAAAQYSTQAVGKLMRTQSAEGAQLSAQLSKFLSTTAGVNWLSTTLDGWEDWLKRTAEPAKLQNLNRLVLSKFSEFVGSDVGRRVVQQLEHEMSAGSLMVPVFVIEELIKHRLRYMVKDHVEKNKVFYLSFFSWRVLASTSLMHVVGGLAKRAAARRKRLSAVVNFVVDVLMPPAVYGPAFGVMVGLHQLVNQKVADPLTTLASKTGTIGTGVSSGNSSVNPGMPEIDLNYQ